MSDNTIVIYGQRIQSQNVRDRWHWRRRHDELQIWRNKLLAAIDGVQAIPEVSRQVVITSYRARLIEDHANLVGGAKGLVDAIVKVGLLKDDADQWTSIRYGQEKCKRTHERTEIVIHGWTPRRPPKQVGHPTQCK